MDEKDLEQPTVDPAASEQQASADDKSATLSFLDSLTDDDANQTKPEDEKVGAPADQDDKPKDEQISETKDEQKPTEQAKPAPEQQEEAELLEGVKSERGQERIKKVFAEKKQLEQDLTEFRSLVQSTGMSPQDFAASLEFGRLVNSGDEKNLKVALEMIEAQRTALYAKLGIEAPGIDLLAEHDDLKKSVEDMEITRDKAVELAKYRKMQADIQASKAQDQLSQQNRQAFDDQVKQASAAMEAYLATRASEVDHPAKMKIIAEHFQDPVRLQSFIDTYQPHQWVATVKMMYDSIKAPQPQANQQQPLRSRPAALGTPDLSNMDPIDRLAQRMQAMGI